MKKFLISLSVMAMMAATAHAAEPLTTDFVNNKGEKLGTATLRDLGKGTLITLDMNLPEGAHAIHIHEGGTCEGDFKSAGGHYNPSKHKHGLESKEGFHAGDLPNLYVESTGHIKAEIFSNQLHLSGKGALSHGAIVVHEKADDYSSDPAGNAGSRIACAVIKQ